MTTRDESDFGFPVVGMIGGGQLARMTHQAAIALGVRLRVLVERASDSAARVTPDVVVGDYRDLHTLMDFAAGCDVITFDHEHVPTEHLEALVAAGVAVHPSPGALVHAQDKIVMRERLTNAGVPCPRWAEVGSVVDVTNFAAGHWPVVLKTARGGYDGRGVFVVDGPDEAARVLAAAPEHTRWLVEQLVSFTRELAVLVARSPHGQAAAYPVVETVQADGICREVIVPASIEPSHALAACEIALRVAATLEVTGVMAVEMFDTPAGVLVNELAMRPHNSGHWTIDGAVTSQFEQHLRAVLDLPLGSTSAVSPHVVMSNVLGGALPDVYPAFLHCMAHDPSLRIHMYGKHVTPGRKIGHVTLCGDDPAALLERARHASDYLTGTISS